MHWSAAVGRVLAPVVIAGAAYGYWQSYRQAWVWAVVGGVVLAIVNLMRAASERKHVFSQPVTINTTAFVVTRLILPVLVLLVGLSALILSGGSWLEAAIVLVFALAVVSLY